MDVYNAALVDVIDGDTIVLDVDLNLHWISNLHVHASDTHVRIAGINAPEKSTTAGKASLVWAKAWFAAHPEILLRVHQAGSEDVETEKYGRVLGDVLTPDGLSYADQAVAAGMAVKWDGHGPRPV